VAQAKKATSIAAKTATLTIMSALIVLPLQSNLVHSVKKPSEPCGMEGFWLER
jgi:hypothetical protein